MDIAKSETRIANGVKRGLESPPKRGLDENNVIISKEAMSRAAEAFAQLDESATGLVPLASLGPFFYELGTGFTEYNIEAIRDQLDIEVDTVLSYPEAIDIATYLLSNVEMDEY